MKFKAMQDPIFTAVHFMHFVFGLCADNSLTRCIYAHSKM